MKTEIIDGKEYQAVAGTGKDTDCDNCVFKCATIDCLLAECDGVFRDDKTDVYFVEIEE